MSRHLILPILCLSAAAFLGRAEVAQAPNPDLPVARINGKVLTRNDLYSKGDPAVLEQRYDTYRVERDTLGRVLDDQLLEQEAHRRNITTAQMVDQEINAKVKDPTDAELRVFYEGAQTDQTFESLRSQLLARVRQTRAKKVREAYLDSLRGPAKIQILLAPPFVEVLPGDAPPRGEKSAPVAFVEFADFECPFCRQMQPEIERLLKNYNGKVAFYFRDFPLSIHAHAEKASEAARCAAQQGAQWPYHDLLFRNENLETANLKAYARAFRLDSAKFDTCLDSAAQSPAVQKDVEAGTRIGVTGTPAFFINGHFISGVVSYETLVEVVDQQLNTAASAK
jgi:predicted DsbA family dithiol-disulfide isomerase